MSFAQTAATFIELLAEAPVQRVTEEKVLVAEKTHKFNTLVGGKHAVREVKVPEIVRAASVSADDTRAFVAASFEHNKKAARAFSALEAGDRRRLLALALATEELSVSAVFAALTHHRGLVGVTADKIRNGLELAAKQGVDLEAESW